MKIDYDDFYQWPKILCRFVLHPKSKVTRIGSTWSRREIIQRKGNCADDLHYKVELDGDKFDYVYHCEYNPNASRKCWYNDFEVRDKTGNQLFWSPDRIDVPRWVRVVLNMRAAHQR